MIKYRREHAMNAREELEKIVNHVVLENILLLHSLTILQNKKTKLMN